MKRNIRNLMVRILDDDILALGAQLAYGLLLSFFPFLIVLLTLVGYSSVSSESVLEVLSILMPNNTFQLIKSTVIEVVNSRKGNLLSFSVIVTLWAASSGFRAVMKALNRAYDTEEKRPYHKLLFTSILCIFGLAIIIIFAFLLLVFGDVIENQLIKWFELGTNFVIFWNIMRYVFMVFFMIFLFASLYHITPSTKLTWKEVMPGATFSTLGWLVSSLVFSTYVNNFNNYSRLYGGIGAVIALIVWIYLSSIIILIGGELNATLKYDKDDLYKPRNKKY